MSDSPGWDRQTLPAAGAPHCWIQWKGTNVCMDFYCKCGAGGHIDNWSVYYIECPECGAVYMTNGHIELVELTLEEAGPVKRGGLCIVRPDTPD